MAVKVILLLFFLFLIFYIVTYPYSFKLERKIKRIMSYKEVEYICSSYNNFNRYSLEEIENRLKIEEYDFSNTDFIDEKIKYIVVKPRELKDKNPRCLILLHGLRDYPEDWINRGKLIENYLTLVDKGKIGDIVFILPHSGFKGESWYTNFYHDSIHRYEDWLSKDLYETIKKEYPNSKFGIAGFSMGGYGAFKIGLKNLDKYDVIGSFSGAVSLVRMSVNRRIIRIFKYLYVPKFLFKDFDKAHFMRVFSCWGYKILKEDPYSLIKKLKPQQIERNKFYISVGAEDKKPYLMVQQWADIIGRLKKYRYNFRGVLHEGEIHTWDYISKDLPHFLKYFYDSTD